MPRTMASVSLIRGPRSIVAQEDHPALRVAVAAAPPRVAQLRQQGLQLSGMAVDVADEVEGGRDGRDGVHCPNLRKAGVERGLDRPLPA